MISLFVLGLRHGADVDHIVALSDIAVAGRSIRQRLTWSALYAGGHALVVMILGTIVIALGSQLPDWMSVVSTWLVGITLIVMGLLVFVDISRGRAPRTRASLIADLVRRRNSSEVIIEHDHDHGSNHGHHHVRSVQADGDLLVRHKHKHSHSGFLPATLTNRGAFGIGIAHGIGAETPTQIALLVAASSASFAIGIGMLALFLSGLFLMNMVVAAVAGIGVRSTQRWTRLTRTVSVVVGCISLWIGVSMLLTLVSR